MSVKKIDLLFGFDTEIPHVGDPNQYTNLAPGSKISARDKYKNSLRAERFTVYEDTFRRLSSILGTIDFSNYSFEEKDKTIGKILDYLYDLNQVLNQKIDDNSFPIKEIYGIGVIRSYTNQLKETASVITENSEWLPGIFNYCPEFEIYKINNRDITLYSGKALTTKTIASLSGEQLNTVAIEPPNILPNVNFNESTGEFPEYVLNKVFLTLDSANNRYVGEIPTYRAENGIPLKLPIETNTFNNSDDIAVKFKNILTDEYIIVYAKSAFDYSNKYFYLYFDNNYLENSLGTLNYNQLNVFETYIYYYYTSWRIDTIIIDTLNKVKVLKGVDEYENNKYPLLNYVELYDIVVAGWDGYSTTYYSSETWRLQGNINPLYIYDTPKYYQKFGIIDKRNIVNVNIAKRNLKDRTLSTGKGQKITSDKLESYFGSNLYTKNSSVVDFNKGFKIKYNSNQFSVINYSNILSGQIYDFENIFKFTGLSIKLYEESTPGVYSEVIKFTDRYLEYTIVEGTTVILHGTTTCPQISLPENIIYYNDKYIEYKSSNIYTINLRVMPNNAGSPFKNYYLFYEQPNSLGNSIKPSFYFGAGLKDYIEYIDDTGYSRDIDYIADETLHTASINNNGYPYVDNSGSEPAIGFLTHSHNPGVVNEEFVKYINLHLTTYNLKNTNLNATTTNSIDLYGTNNVGNASQIMSVKYEYSNGFLHFAALVKVYKAVNDTNSVYDIITGTVIPRTAKFIASFKDLGDQTYFQNHALSGYNTIKPWYNDILLGVDIEGNKAIGYVGRFVNTAGEVDFFDNTNYLYITLLNQSLQARGYYRKEISNFADCSLLNTTNIFGIYSTLYINKETPNSWEIGLVISVDNNETKFIGFESTELKWTHTITDSVFSGSTNIKILGNYFKDNILDIVFSYINSGEVYIETLQYSIDFNGCNFLRKIKTNITNIEPTIIDNTLSFYKDYTNIIVVGNSAPNIKKAIIISGIDGFKVITLNSVDDILPEVVAKDNLVSFIFDTEIKYLLQPEKYGLQLTKKEPIIKPDTLYQGYYLDDFIKMNIEQG